MLKTPPLFLKILFLLPNENSEEEFEPLFDYSRVQPFNVVCIDDDPLDLPSIGCIKKHKKADTDVEKGKNVDASNVIDLDEEDDDDWLLPPPKVATNSTSFEHDSVLKKLRIQKQELAEFAKSAKDELQSVEENVRRDIAAEEYSKRNLNGLLESAAEGGGKQPSRPVNEREKIVITVQDKNETKQFRVFMDDKFDKFFKMYAEKLKLDLKSLVFRFDGDKVNPLSTPKDLGMEDNDMIEVDVKKN